jgi:hypothetical protein
MLNMARYLLLLLLLACPLHAVVSSPTSATSYQGAGTTPAYPYTWGISQPSDLVCYELIVATGAITKLNLTADYTVSGVGIYTGGTVTLTAGNLPTGTSLLIASDPAQVQLLLLQQGAPFNPADLMNALDYLTREVQATRRVANNAIQIPLSESVAGLNTTLPSVALRANTFPIFDNAGNITVSASDIADRPGGGKCGIVARPGHHSSDRTNICHKGLRYHQRRRSGPICVELVRYDHG